METKDEVVPCPRCFGAGKPPMPKWMEELQQPGLEWAVNIARLKPCRTCRGTGQLTATDIERSLLQHQGIPVWCSKCKLTVSELADSCWQCGGPTSNIPYDD